MNRHVISSTRVVRVVRHVCHVVDVDLQELFKLFSCQGEENTRFYMKPDMNEEHDINHTAQIPRREANTNTNITSQDVTHRSQHSNDNASHHITRHVST
jgi:hypothetical protein